MNQHVLLCTLQSCCLQEFKGVAKQIRKCQEIILAIGEVQLVILFGLIYNYVPWSLILIIVTNSLLN